MHGIPASVANPCRHPDLQPVTLTALADAFKLNNINFGYAMDGSYDCEVTAAGLSRVINPFDGAEVLKFFNDVINDLAQPR